MQVAAQTRMQYHYDAAGNRISRTFVEAQPTQNAPRLMGHGGEVTVSPTVTTGEVTITTTLDPEQTSLSYIVSNLQGGVLAVGDITARQTAVQLGNFSDGIYLLSVQRAQGTTTFKVIKR